MSKFLELCESVHSYLREAGEFDPNAAPAAPAAPTNPNANSVIPPEVKEQPPVGNATNSDPAHIATNDDIKDIVTFLSKYLVDKLPKDDGLRKKLLLVSQNDNSDEKTKDTIEALKGVVDPNITSTETFVPPAETGGEATTN
jgi:hypothetical protein